MAGGAGYRAIVRERSGDDESLRSRAAFPDSILERLEAMTSAERHQFDRLMKGSAPTR